MQERVFTNKGLCLCCLWSCGSDFSSWFGKDFAVCFLYPFVYLGLSFLVTFHISFGFFFCLIYTIDSETDLIFLVGMIRSLVFFLCTFLGHIFSHTLVSVTHTFASGLSVYFTPSILKLTLIIFVGMVRILVFLYILLWSHIFLCHYSFSYSHVCFRSFCLIYTINSETDLDRTHMHTHTHTHEHKLLPSYTTVSRTPKTGTMHLQALSGRVGTGWLAGERESSTRSNHGE